MSEHKLLFSLIVLASIASLGWVLIVYILSFHGARWLVDSIACADVPRRRDLRLALSPGLRQYRFRMC